MFDICYYHKKCSDGIVAAWTAYLYSDNIKTIPIAPTFRKYTDEDIVNSKIIFVDICPLESEFENILRKCEKLVLLDHHKTNEELYCSSEFINKYKREIDSGKLEIIIDMKRSGCQIAWDYFTYNTTEENLMRWKNISDNTFNYVLKRPWFVDYVGDVDLWIWTRKNCKEISASLNKDGYLDSIDSICNLFKKSYIDYDTIKHNLIENIENIKNKIIEKGAIHILENDRMINNYLQNHTELRLYLNPELNIYQLVTYVICDHHEIRSELGNKSLDIRYNLYDKYTTDEINKIVKLSNESGIRVSNKIKRLINFYNTDFPSKDYINVSALTNIHDSTKIDDRWQFTGLNPDFAVIVNEIKDDKFVGLSLRSSGEKGLQDVSIIAKQLDGGGHRNAAGGRIVYDKKNKIDVRTMLDNTFMKI
jgi:oligoribonuclease NrnB/cAMP/cGMP phosphodiesterase (DHH superfamily)